MAVNYLQPTTALVPDYYRNHKTITYNILFLSDNGLAHITNWFDRMMEVIRFLKCNIPSNQHKHKARHYLIQWNQASDGTGMWIEFPTRNGWTDFLWHYGTPLIRLNGTATRKPSLYDVQDITWDMKHEDPIKYAFVAAMIHDLKEKGVMPNSAEMAKYTFSNPNSLEALMHCIHIAFVEQLNKNSEGLGMDMLYSLLPPTLEDVSNSVDLMEGELTLRWSLHEALTHHMSLKQVVEMVEERWKKTSKDKEKRRFFNADGYFPETGKVCLRYTRTVPFVFALGKNYSDILLLALRCEPGALYLDLQEEHKNAASMMEWLNRDVIPFANSFDGTRAQFKDCHVTILPNGCAEICLYQDWTEKELVTLMNRKRTIHKHKETPEVPTAD